MTFYTSPAKKVQNLQKYCPKKYPLVNCCLFYCLNSSDRLGLDFPIKKKHFDFGRWELNNSCGHRCIGRDYVCCTTEFLSGAPGAFPTKNKFLYIYRFQSVINLEVLLVQLGSGLPRDPRSLSNPGFGLHNVKEHTNSS